MKFHPKTSKGSQMFAVPNTPEGLEFIKNLRKFLNKRKFENDTDFTISIRGRGSRKAYAQVAGRYNAQSGVSMKYAEWFAVYVSSASIRANWYKYYRDSYSKDGEIRNLKDQIEVLQKVINNHNLKDQIEVLQKDLTNTSIGVTTSNKTQLDDACNTINDLLEQNNNLKESLRTAMQGEILPDTSDIKGQIKITLPNGTVIEFRN